MIKKQRKWHQLIWMILPILLAGFVLLLTMFPRTQPFNETLPFLQGEQLKEAELP